MEKQKNSRVEAMMREQRVAMEKELNVIQAKSQSSYQELNTYQMKVKLFLAHIVFVRTSDPNDHHVKSNRLLSFLCVWILFILNVLVFLQRPVNHCLKSFVRRLSTQIFPFSWV